MNLFYGPTQEDLDKESVLAKLGQKKLELLCKVITLAEKELTTEHKALLFDLEARTIVGVLHDLIYKYCKIYFTDDDVTVIRTAETFIISFTGLNVVVRYKKVGRNRLSHNIPTENALNYLRQQPSLFPIGVNLIVGYQVQENMLDGNLVKSIYLICPRSETKNYWSWLLNAENAKNVVSANVVAANEKRKARFVPKKKRDIAVEQTK